MNDLRDRQESIECSHELCRCILMGPLVGETFCSSFCRSSTESGIEGEQCSCGHPECDS
jgi:hypothetical protein